MSQAALKLHNDKAQGQTETAISDRIYVAPSSPASLDPLKTEESNVWAAIASERYSEGLNFSALSANQKVLILADTDHAVVAIQRGLIDSLAALKAAGISHLALEIPSDLSISDLSSITSNVRLPHCTAELVTRAETLGIQLRVIDMPFSEQNLIADPETRNHHRGIYMGKKISEILKDEPDAKIAAIVGYSHLRNKEQIASVLQQNDISFKGVACVTKGQHLRQGQLGATFMEVPVVSGIMSATQNKAHHGYLDLQGMNTGADGVILFPRPLPRSAQLRMLNSLTADPTEINDCGLQIKAPKGMISCSAYENYAHPDLVMANSLNWRTDNQAKIIDLMSNLVTQNAITNSEALYLAALLSAYAENTGSHSLDGSIVEIGFVSEGQYFEITTVDTCQSQFNSLQDYGARTRHYEISISSLQQKFGKYFESDGSQATFDRSEITYNPENPDSAIKFLSYLTTAIQHPDRLQVYAYLGTDNQLRVYAKDNPSPGSPYLASLTVSDFKLSEVEKKFIEIQKDLWRTGDLIYSLKFNQDVINAAETISLKTKLFGRALAAKDQQLIKSVDPHPGFYFRPEPLILYARSQIRTLNMQEANELKKTLEKSLNNLGQLFDSIERVIERNSELYEIPLQNDFQTDGQAKSLGQKLEVSREALEELKADFSKLQPSFKSVDVQT